MASLRVQHVDVSSSDFHFNWGTPARMCGRHWFDRLGGWGELGRKFQELGWFAPDTVTRLVFLGATHAPDSADGAGLVGDVMDGAIQLFSAWAFLGGGLVLCLTVFPWELFRSKAKTS